MQSSRKDNCIQHSFLNLYFFIASRTKNRTSGAVQHTPISTPIPHGKVGASAVCQTATAVNITAIERRMSAMRSRTRRYTSARLNTVTLVPTFHVCGKKLTASIKASHRMPMTGVIQSVPRLP